jgi:predicted permease
MAVQSDCLGTDVVDACEEFDRCEDNRNVLKILVITFPFFALVLCGYLAARRHMLSLDAIPGLNGFVLFFALPCMLYRFGASTPIAQLLDVSVGLTWLACGLIMVGFTVVTSLNARIGWNDAAFGALVAAFPNSGFMGVPLLVALLGAKAAGPTILTMVIDMIVITSLCIALSRLDGADEHGAAKALKNALKGVLTNPMPWAILLGALVSVLGLELPKPVTQTVGLLADAASPVALFTIGAVLARSQMLAAAGHVAAPRLGDYLPVALLKLFLHPLLVLLVGASLISLGLPLDRFAFTVLVLVAALPSASNVSLLAERFGADNGRVARIILVSTAAAFVTFSLAVALMA